MQVKFEFTFYGPVFVVAQGDADFQVRFGEGLRIQVRNDEDILDADGAGRMEADRADDAHAFVQRARVPVHEAEVQVAALGALQADFEAVALFQQGSDIIDILAERTEGGVGRSDLFPVEEDVGPVVQSVEDEVGMRALGGDELRLVDPGVVEDRLVHFGVVPADEQVISEITGFFQDAGDGRGDRGYIDFLAPGTAEFPVRIESEGLSGLEDKARVAGTGNGCEGDNPSKSFGHMRLDFVSFLQKYRTGLEN